MENITVLNETFVSKGKISVSVKLAENFDFVIVGMGKTGLACARFLQQQQKTFCVLDTREQPAGLKDLQQQLPGVDVFCADWPADILERAGEIILSPGLALADFDWSAAVKAKVIGDIELFYRYAKAPIVAITGSNAKSSVTTLLGECLLAAGKRVAIGGNLGVPALSLLNDDIELYVLELSSFQLELVKTFAAQVAVLLNISEDHMDRYADMAEYIQAKHRIFERAANVVYFADDKQTRPLNKTAPVWVFGRELNSIDAESAQAIMGLVEQDHRYYLQCDQELLCAADDFVLPGQHVLVNALAVIACLRALAIDLKPLLPVITGFKGLPHRCEVVANKAGVIFINDSKGTNVGASEAAIRGLAQCKNIILIAGGEGKGADFTALQNVCQHYVRTVLLIGRDANKIAAAIGDVCHCINAISMESAVAQAFELASVGDVVLLSPACASFDQFKNFEHRGEVFKQCVSDLTVSNNGAKGGLGDVS